MSRYLRQFEQRGELEILREEAVVYDDRVFVDWLHLNAAGTLQLSCELRDTRLLLARKLDDVSVRRTKLIGSGGDSASSASDGTVAAALLRRYCLAGTHAAAATP
jgi:hypothetical protein